MAPRKPQEGPKKDQDGGAKKKKNENKNTKKHSQKIDKKYRKKSISRGILEILASPCKMQKFLEEGVKCGILERHKKFYYVKDQTIPAGKKPNDSDDEQLEDLDSMDSMDIKKVIANCVNERAIEIYDKRQGDDGVVSEAQASLPLESFNRLAEVEFVVKPTRKIKKPTKAKRSKNAAELPKSADEKLADDKQADDKPANDNLTDDKPAVDKLDDDKLDDDKQADGKLAMVWRWLWPWY